MAGVRAPGLTIITGSASTPTAAAQAAASARTTTTTAIVPSSTSTGTTNELELGKVRLAAAAAPTPGTTDAAFLAAHAAKGGNSALDYAAFARDKPMWRLLFAHSSKYMCSVQRSRVRRRRVDYVKQLRERALVFVIRTREKVEGIRKQLAVAEYEACLAQYQEEWAVTTKQEVEDDIVRDSAPPLVVTVLISLPLNLNFKFSASLSVPVPVLTTGSLPVRLHLLRVLVVQAINCCWSDLKSPFKLTLATPSRKSSRWLPCSSCFSSLLALTTRRPLPAGLLWPPSLPVSSLLRR
jgi:hypothetical protein